MSRVQGVQIKLFEPYTIRLSKTKSGSEYDFDSPQGYFHFYGRAKLSLKIRSVPTFALPRQKFWNNFWYQVYYCVDKSP